LSEYESLLEKKPKDAALRYNAGAAAFQAGKLEDAAEHFGSALATQDPQLQQRAYYNLGNTQFRLGEDAGEPDKTQKMWEQSIQSYETALKLNPQDDDAQHNLRWVKQRLEELKKQQQQQQQQQDSDSKDKDDPKEGRPGKESGSERQEFQERPEPGPKSGKVLPEKKDQDQAKQDSSPRRSPRRRTNRNLRSRNPIRKIRKQARKTRNQRRTSATKRMVPNPSQASAA
jgi:Ca-activated chloride channel family protein